MKTQAADAPRITRAVITRSSRGNQELARRLRSLGFEPVSVDTIEFLPPKDWSRVDESISRLSGFDWLLFTSPTGVDFFFERMRELGLTARWRGRPDVAAVGESTASALRAHGIRVRFIPSEYLTMSLARELPTDRGREVLFLRADKGDPKAAAALEGRGFRVCDVKVYRTVSASGGSDAHPLDGAHVVLFASPSAVEAFAQSHDEARMLPAICIGPVTAQAAIEHGFERTITARTHTVDGLVDALVASSREGAWIC